MSVLTINPPRVEVLWQGGAATFSDGVLLRMCSTFWLAGFFLLWGVGAIAQPAAQNLDRQLQGIVAAHQGKIAYYARDVSRGTVVEHDANTPVQTASVIKLAILYEALEQIRSGKASWGEKLTLQQADRVGGSGILTFLDAPLSLTLKDVITLMIDFSDNTATNLLIDRFTIKAVNARMDSIGLHQTRLYKKVFKPATEPLPAEQPKFGLGKTTAAEMATLMLRFAQCALDPDGKAASSESDIALCNTAVDILRHQFYRDDIPRYLEKLDSTEEGTAIANKTGALDAVRNDVAAIGTKHGLIVVSIFTYENADQSWTPDNEAELTIARIGERIVHSWAADGLDANALKPKAQGMKP